MKNSSLKYSLIFALTLATLLLSSSGYAQKANWKKIELDFCSFVAPSDLSLTSNWIEDSRVWAFQSDDLRLTIDLGLHSEPDNINKAESDYIESQVKVGKMKASIVQFKYRKLKPDGFHYVTAIYFPKVSSKVGDKYTKLSFVAHSKTAKHQKLAEEILRSINFK